ncbi:MAG: ATP-grasp domain-containing protein [Treponema sp.]|jgi:biotin carboxylase|nr:ATP-grasp domain-containing protein [Treponema sp.]
MRESILIVGAGIMQGPAIRTAREMGLFTVAADGDPGAVSASMADRFERVDLKDRDGMEKLALSLRADSGTKFGGIMTAGTDFSATVAWVAERLGLPGIPFEAALNASDKERMRSCFRKAGVPSPGFTVIREVPDEDTGEFSYPLVVKPVDNMGGRGCRRADTFAGLREAAADSLRFSRSGRAIVESFMDGPEFSVDAVIYRGEITICGLADRHIFFPPYFIEMGHTMPTRAESGTQRLLLETFEAGIRALGIAGENCCGAAKGDIKLTSSGPMIGEIAARLSGGYMSGWTCPYASGAEPVRGAILAALGRKPEGLRPVRSWTCAERAFISIPGKVRDILDGEKARNTRYVRDVFFRIEKGSAVNFPENNVGKCGNVIAAAPDRESAVSAAERAAAAVLVRLEAPRAETAAFLDAWFQDEGPDEKPGRDGSPAFPPDAFPAGPSLRALLRDIPDPPPAYPAGDTILDFPAFTAPNPGDWMGRTVEESLEAVRRITGCPLAPVKTVRGGTLGRRFWAALIRGGYQGAAYLLDELGHGDGS